MHSLEEVRAEYNRLDRVIGINSSAIELKISKRAVKQLGSFRAPKKPGTAPLRITLAEQIFSDDAQFWDTVRHEYAHAAVYLLHPKERHGHDAVWKQMCLRVGCDPSRLAKESPEMKQQREQSAKYMVRCEGCGRETLYQRRGKIVELLMRGRGGTIQCTACGSRKFKLFVKA